MNNKQIFLILLGIFFLLPVFGQYNLTGYWTADDGGHYYVRQVGNSVYWFGEHPSGYWANVFKGQLNNNTRAAILRGARVTLNGKFWDVPKGGGQGTGELVIHVTGSRAFQKISGPFGGRNFTKSRRPSRLPGYRPQGFSDTGLSGLWSCNDGGRYYIRQIGDVVIWFGEKIKSNGQAEFANVAFGRRNRNRIQLVWLDAPKGSTNGRGYLNLIVSGQFLRRENATGGFFGSRWQKGSPTGNCSEFQRDVRTLSAGLTSYLNDSLAGTRYDFLPRKAVIIEGVQHISANGCRLEMVLNIKLRREGIRKDGVGTVKIYGNVHEYAAGRLCVNNFRLGSLNLGNTTNLGERFIPWILNKIGNESDEMCYRIF